MTRYLTNLAGLSFRPADAKEVVRLLVVGDEIELRRESDNAYDENAIQIWAGGEVRQFIGYVEKIMNTDLAADLDNGFTYTATVKQVYQDHGEGGKNPQWMRPLFEIVTTAVDA